MNLTQHPTHIHGLELDIRHEDKGQFSAWPMTASEYGATRFPDGKWMVTLPMACACADSFEAALAYARIQQRHELWGDGRRPSLSWTGPEGDAWIAAGGTLD